MKKRLNTQIVNGQLPASRPYEIWDTGQKGLLLRVQPSGSKTFYCQYARGRRRKILNISERDWTITQVRAAAQSIIDKHSDMPLPKKSPKLAKFLSECYFPFVEAERKTGSQIKRRITSNFSHLFNRKLENIDAELIGSWRIREAKRGKSRATINNDVATFKAAFSWAVTHGYLQVNPLTNIKPYKIDNARVRYLDAGEELRLRQALVERENELKVSRRSANKWRAQRNYELLPEKAEYDFIDHLQPICLLAMNTGMRRGEIFSLRWSDVNLSQHHPQLTVQASTTKSAKRRHIPLNREAGEVLRRWKRQGSGAELVFPGRGGERLNNIDKAFKGLMRRADLAGFTFHDFRHHFASRLVMADVAINTVRELLGHADLKMTLRYAHLAPEMKSDAVQRLDSL